MKNHHKARFCAMGLLLLIAACLLGSCQKNSINLESQNGKVWQLVSLDEKDIRHEIPADTKITMIIDGNRIYGYSGVNSYTGTLEMQKKTIRMGPFAATLMAGSEETLNFERLYLRLLEGVNFAEFDNDKLILLNEKTKTRIAFSEFSLAGTKWQLTGYNTGGAIVSDALSQNAYIELGPEGKLSGTSGYNRFTGTYSYTPEDGMTNVTITGMTKMAPPPEAVGFEQLLVTLLDDAKKFSCDGHTLRLANDEGTTLLSFSFVAQ